MIKLDKKSFLAIGEETQTSKKTELLSVHYTHVLLTKVIEEEIVPQGFIKSFVYNEAKDIILEDLQEDTNFVGNILIQLTDNYIGKLELLNPEIKFTNTLK
jgi:hypothetical protein